MLLWGTNAKIPARKPTGYEMMYPLYLRPECAGFFSPKCTS